MRDSRPVPTRRAIAIDTHSNTSSRDIIAVIIPSFRVIPHVGEVVRRIGLECDLIYVVDDACPDGSGEYVEQHCHDPRIRILRHGENQGVGAAVMTGYRAAMRDGATILVKIDGDGQMPPELLERFVRPLRQGMADYTKGNRFYDPEGVHAMPAMRLFGNTVLSFMAKFSTGYWDIFDPTNGYTAIHARVAAHLPLHRISTRYFFETDMLYRLNVLRAVVMDIPMAARYADEVSNLRISRIFGEFMWKHARNFFKRIFYNYFLRDLSAASLQLLAGILLLAGGTAFGLLQWQQSFQSGTPAPAGTVMLAALPVMLGIQLLLAFLSYDIQAVPRIPIFPRLADAPDRPDERTKRIQEGNVTR